MAYKVKRGSASTNLSIKEMLGNFFKRLLVLMIILSLMVGLGYFLFQFAYEEFPIFAEAADDLVTFFKGFYREHGIWTTIGFIGFVCMAVWAWGEEEKRKERRNEAMKQVMK